MIPKVDQHFEINEEIVKIKKDTLLKLKEAFPGYIQLNDILNQPDPDKYEVEDSDITFLTGLFPKDFKSLSLNSPNIANHPIILDFVKLFEHFDATRNFSTSNLKLATQRFSDEIVLKVVDYWKYKTLKTKHPILRRFWKANIKKQEFGDLDSLRVAFRDREKERMRLRKIRKLTNQEILDNLEQLKEEAETALILSRLITKREQIKMISLQASILKEEIPLSMKEIKAEFGPKCKELLQKADAKLHKFQPPTPVPEQVIPKPEVKLPVGLPAPVPPKPVDNDVSYFISSLISELNAHGFEPSDFKVDNINSLNEKIRKVKKGSNSQSATSNERILSFLPPVQNVAKAENEDLLFFKRYSYSNSSEVFIEKLDQSKLTAEDSNFEALNFTADYQAKIPAEFMKSNFSLCHLSLASGLNPHVYCGANSYSTSNNYLELVKLKRYNELFSEFQGFEDSLENSYSLTKRGIEYSLGSLAEEQVKDLKLDQGFKVFLNLKKVK